MSNKPFFYLEKKSNVSFWSYLDFFVFGESTNFEIYDVIIDITTP